MMRLHIAAKSMSVALMFLLMTAGVSYASTVGGTQTLVAGNNAFAFDLYGQIAERQGNIFISPYSISSALAMTYVGAKGDTAAQMRKALHFVMSQEQIHEAFGQLNEMLNASGKSYKLSVANALWSQVGLKFVPSFVDTVQKYYGAGFKLVDFANATEQARITINSWVEEQTQNKIVELIKPKILDELTRLVLTNAIYFKGQWEQQFDKKLTADAPFYVSGKEKVSAPFMNLKGTFKYAEGDGYQALELPYKGGELSMVIILPSEASGISKLEAKLKSEGIGAYLNGFIPTTVDVSLPKFKYETALGLSAYLQRMGMVDAFDDSLADFSGISDTFLYITHVIHQAFIEVNEEGSEAAAATAVVMGTKSVQWMKEAKFVADRPFFFVIRDLRSGSLLFMGRVSNPKA